MNFNNNTYYKIDLQYHNELSDQPNLIMLQKSAQHLPAPDQQAPVINSQYLSQDAYAWANANMSHNNVFSCTNASSYVYTPHIYECITSM